DHRDPAVPLTGLDAPALRITLETDRPGESGTPTAAHKAEMAIGGPADSSGRRLYATIHSGGTPPRARVVDAIELVGQALSSAPLAYISQVVTQVEPADAGMILLSAAAPPAPGVKNPPPPEPSDRRIRRTMGRWADVDASGKELMLADAD